MYNLTPDDKEILKTLAKRRNIYTIIFAVLFLGGGAFELIPLKSIGVYIGSALMIIGGVFAGLAMLCINYYRKVKSGGTKQGGGLWWVILLVLGLFIMPILTVFVCNHCSPLAEKVLGATLID